MTVARLGDGTEGLADTLGGGPVEESTLSLGPRGTLFLGQRPRQHEVNLLAASQPRTFTVVPDPITIGGGGGVGGDGDGGGSAGGGDGGGDGGDG